MQKKKTLKKKAGDSELGTSDRAGFERAASPLYQQVVGELRNDILKGAFPVGTKLPTEDLLSQRFEVSRHTIREALRQLRADGLVSSRQGSGTLIERPSSSKSYVHEVESINDLISYAASVAYKVDASELIHDDPQLGELIGDDAQGAWLRVEGYRFAKEAEPPLCWTKIYIHADYANVGRLIGRGRGAVYELIEDLHGVRVAEVTQVVKAKPASATLAEGLQVEAGATVIEVVRVYRLSSSKIAEVAVNYYPADRFTISMTLRRSR